VDGVIFRASSWNSEWSPAIRAIFTSTTIRSPQITDANPSQIHWPVQFESSTNQFPTHPSGKIALSDTPLSETWRALERIHTSTKKVRAIGVSNFNRQRLESLLESATVPPAVNQIEAHPFLQQPELLAWHKEKNIHITAYSPLGNNVYGKARVIDDEAVNAVAKEAGKSVAQVLIAWAVQRGTSVVPKSVNKERIESNFQGMSLPPKPWINRLLTHCIAEELSQESFEKLNKLERNQRYNDPIEWGFDVFGERTQEELDKASEEFAAKNKK
jgi:L-glyceraldehyde reductase